MRGRRAPSRFCPPAKPDQGESNVGLRGAMAASFVACWAPLSLRTGQTRGNDQGFSLARRSGGLRSVVLTPPLGRQLWVHPRSAAAPRARWRNSRGRDSGSAAFVRVTPQIGEVFIWGQDDRYLGSELAEPDHDDVPNLDRVERLPDASHWVHHDEPERVTRLLTDFFAPARAAQY